MLEAFKGPFVNGSQIAATEILFRLCVAAVFGGVVALVYRRSRHEIDITPTFPPTLVLLAILIGMVTQVIGDNVALAFSLVGALAIVRFRTVVRDTQDTAFVMLSVVVGMAVGARAPWVAAIGLAKGKLIEKEMLAEPNYALEDHWNEGCLQALIKSGYYDFVVVQQGPSSQADGAKSLLEYGGYIQELCKANDTKLAFYMVWPARINYHTFPGVITNYTNAAYATGAILCPAGQAWKQYIDRTGDWSYYGPDEFHPSALGTQVAAEVIYKSIFP